VGDTLELQGQWAVVKTIGLRATRIRTYDNADVIVPNNDLISGQVTNWSLSGRIMRLKVPVGVAYGSDVPLVIETLLDAAKNHTDVTARPEPKVLFLNFGDSTLNFELRAWISNCDERRRIRSELNQEIEQRFRNAGIEIAFPQRDLHIKTLVTDVVADH
jgi:small-conductance mechanosensitive channel